MRPTKVQIAGIVLSLIIVILVIAIVVMRLRRPRIMYAEAPRVAVLATPVATPVATPTPTAVATPVAKAWPELSQLDEMLHDAFFFRRDDDAESIRGLLPKMEPALSAVAHADPPKLPGADRAWVLRRQEDLKRTRSAVLDVTKMSDAEVFAAVDSVVPIVEVMMSATDHDHVPVFGGQVSWLKPAVPAGLPVAETPRP